MPRPLSPLSLSSVSLLTSLRVASLRVCGSDPNLAFVESPALKPPEVVIDQSTVAMYEQELHAAQNVPLPDEEEDL